ncbi:hypothetical protein IIA29_12830 [candidate division KSB1 bacterium]|nr:hypothetical protein [candidate division KSB1 bacterium]
METIKVKSTDDKIIITIDKSAVNIDFLTNLLNKFRVEQLIHKANFDEQILKLSEEIKQGWWGKNKAEFLSKD